MEAIVGEELRVMCNDITCFRQIYSWSKIYKNGTSQPLNESSNTYIITQNVTSVLAVGGQEYQCKCTEGDACRQFTIWGTFLTHPEEFNYHLMNVITYTILFNTCGMQ